MEFPVAPWLGVWALTAGAIDWIPGLGIKILHTMHGMPPQKRKKNTYIFFQRKYVTVHKMMLNTTHHWENENEVRYNFTISRIFILSKIIKSVGKKKKKEKPSTLLLRIK